MICIKRNPSKRNSLVIPVKIIRNNPFHLWILHLLVKLNPVVHVRQNDPAQDLFKLPPFIQITVITGHDFSQSLYFGYFFIPSLFWIIKNPVGIWCRYKRTAGLLFRPVRDGMVLLSPSFYPYVSPTAHTTIPAPSSHPYVAPTAHHENFINILAWIHWNQAVHMFKVPVYKIDSKNSGRIQGFSPKYTFHSGNVKRSFISPSLSFSSSNNSFEISSTDLRGLYL